MRRQMVLRVFGLTLLPLVGFLLGAGQPWWLQAGLILLLAGLGLWLSGRNPQLGTTPQAVYGLTIGNWFLILGIYYLSSEPGVWGETPGLALAGLAGLTGLHLLVVGLHLWLNPLAAGGARRVLLLTLGYVCIMGLIVWGLWQLGLVPVLPVCLMIGSMLYFLGTLSFLSKDSGATSH